MSFNVAIDGPSAAGKSTIAAKIADKYNLKMLDTGAMYRSVALAAKEAEIDYNDPHELTQLLKDIKLSLSTDNQFLLDGQPVNQRIRNDEISMLASSISKHEVVREYLVSLQQEIAQDKGYVLEGRDIGTVVLPEAEVKIFLVASSDTRAQRRYQEYIDKGLTVDFDEIKRDIEKRDLQDTTRANSPLIQAKDAIKVDSSDLTIDEVIEEISRIINKKVGV